MRRKRRYIPRAENRQHAAGIFLGENPNVGKRHASNGSAARELTASERIREARTRYEALTVSTLIDFDRAGRRVPASRVTRTQYTV